MVIVERFYIIEDYAKIFNNLTKSVKVLYVSDIRTNIYGYILFNQRPVCVIP